MKYQLPQIEASNQELLAMIGELQVALNIRENQLVATVQERDAAREELKLLKEAPTNGAVEKEKEKAKAS